MPEYLLDVNVLVAHAILEHEHHQVVADRLRQLAEEGSRFHSCPIVELGLLRNAMRLGSLSLVEGKELLANERVNLDLQFIPDDISVSALPEWVQGYHQTTDAYLIALAETHSLKLLTIDKSIPESERLLS